MRKLCLLAVVFAPLALAESVSVEPHSLLRLPASSSVLQLQRLEVADYGTLLIPANLTELSIEQLQLGHEARIAVVPGEQELRLRALHAQLGTGSQILARGAPGTHQKAARAGRNLDVQLQSIDAQELNIDARGGAGADGYAGLDGGNGQAPGCTWGSAGRGSNGDNGGDGLPGASGANVRLRLPASFAGDAIKVRTDGGQGGAAGIPGRAGAGGKSKGCLVYRAEGGQSGREGLPGRAGEAGAAGALSVQRF
jgi:hypothetical protein